MTTPAATGIKLTLRLQRIVHAPASDLWRVVGTEFEHIGAWSSGIAASEPSRRDAPVGDCPVGGRACQADVPLFGRIEERLTRFDDTERVLSYVATVVPPFLRSAQNTWSVEVVSPSTSRVRSVAVVEFKLPTGIVLWLPMKLMFVFQGRRALADLAHYVEHGEPSRAKRRGMRRRRSRSSAGAK